MTVVQYEQPAPLPPTRASDELETGPTGWVARLRAAAEIANYVGETEFVPEPLRGRHAAIAAAILTGGELGLQPMRALAWIALIQGKPAMLAEGQRAMILAEGKNNDAFYIISKGTVDVILPRANQSDVIALQLGPGKYFGEMEFFHERRSRASIRACETCPVEVLALDYDTLSSLLNESEPTREALHQAANKHENENIEWREVKG